MMRFAFAFVVVVLGFVGSASAQAKSFTKTSFSSPGEYAFLIERCDKGSLNLSCEELISSFNRAFDDIDDLETPEHLASFIMETVVKPCPNVMTRIARVVDGKVDLEYRRMLRVGEQCLFDQNSQRFVSSMGCGQWIPDQHPVFTAQKIASAIREEESQGPDPNARIPVARVPVSEPKKRSWLSRNWKWVVPVAAVLGAGSFYAIREARRWNGDDSFVLTNILTIR